MIFFIGRRAISLVLVLWVIVTVTFALLNTVKGGPFDKERRFSPEVEKNLRARYHFDEPIWKRYGRYIGAVSRFDFGPSFYYEDKTVNDIIRQNWSTSATLGIISVLISLSLGIPIGVIAALRQNRWVDHLSMFGAIVCVSVPNFVLAAILIHFFVNKLGWQLLGWASWKNAILPSLALSAFSLAYITRMTRASMLETIRSDYVRTARAKGLSMSQAVIRHALRNALLPVVTYLGPLIAGVTTGSFVVESFFGIPGLGRYFVMGLNNRDHAVVLGLAVLYSSLLVAMNTLVDILYAWLDPRIKTY
ncbi:MAG: ABC transporter permease [Candidatus Sumerlaeota bacterium]|nr:ABC transporter permease [Candidatus Sumerlaeota bacterium]